MERAGFECEQCQTDEETLNVHHGYYEKGLKPWEYPDESLHCYCETCHKEARELDYRLKRLVGSVNPVYLAIMIGYVEGLIFRDGNTCYEPPESISISDLEELCGFADFWHIDQQTMEKRWIDNHGIVTLGMIEDLRRG